MDMQMSLIAISAPRSDRAAVVVVRVKAIVRIQIGAANFAGLACHVCQQLQRFLVSYSQRPEPLFQTDFVLKKNQKVVKKFVIIIN